MTDTVDLSGRQFGEFVLRERIGEGSFGAVYCCEQPLLGREAVVKVLHPKLHHDDVSVQRFLREAQLASRLDHPYAAHVYAFGLEEHERLLWIAMERVQGVTLKSWLRDHGPMSLEQFVPFFECLAEVVQTAHERGIVHRDLKPSNIMVIERAGRLLPKLLDLGVAKLLGDAVLPQVTQDIIRRAISAELALEPAPRGPKPGVGAQTLTGKWVPPRREHWPAPPSTLSTVDSDSPPSQREGRSWLTSDDATVGSPPYMSPEQWSNAVTVGPGSDLYSLAVVAFEALTGHRPFDGNTLGDYAELHCHGKVPSIGASFPSALDQMFQRALAKRPEERWSTALEMARALRTASGVGTSWADLPRIDAGVRDAWLAGAPQPLAESIAALDGARNAHQAHIAIQELARDLVRYLLAVTLAAHAHTQAAEGQDDPALLELVRALDRRELSMDERVQLIRLLVRPLIGQRDSHPIPALVDLVTPGPDGADDLEPMLTLHATLDHAGTDDLVRSRVHRLVPELTELLRRTRFLLDYLLVVPCRGAAERWAGVRRDPRAAAEVVAGELVDEHPALVDRAGRACLDLWPLVQAVALDDGDAPQLFVFDGNGPHGALMVATPLGVERHDTLARAWVGSHVIAGIEAKARMRDQIRVAAHQWQACDHSNALLWRGDVLEDLERWTRHTSARRLDELETSFVAASRRLARHGRWIRRSLIAAGVAIALAGVQYRATLQTQLARQHARMAQELADRSVIQAEVEEGRQALLHDESAEAQRHLLEAHRRGDNSPSVAFMLARATQPLRAEQARFASAMGRMWSAAFSPDGEQIVTTDDAGARIWSARSYQLLYTLPHGGEVYHAVYSGDGRRLVTATADAIKIWDPATGSEVRELTHRPADGPPPNYYIVAVSGDGRFIAAIDAMGARADVWNAATGVLVAALRDDASEFPSIAFSADSRWLATSGGDDVRVFDTATWAQALTIPGPHIHALGFDPTGPRLATGSATGDAAIWQIPSGARIRHLRETGEPVDRLAFAPSGELVATGARDGAEQIWSASSGALLSQLNLLHGKILAIEFDRTSKLVVAASAGGSLAVVDATLGLPITVLEGPRNVVRSAHFDPSSRRVVGASWDGTARVWDATSPYRQFSSAPLADDCGIVANLEPDQRFVAIGCRDHKTRVWDTARDRLLAELPSVSPVEGDLASALPAVSADGDRAAIARGSVVEIYELPGGRLLREVRHAQPVTAVAFGMGGHDLITGAADGSLVVTRDGREPAPLAPSSAAIDAAWLIPGDRALAVDAHRRLRVLDVARGKLLADREMPTRVRILRPSPDGRRLVTIPSYSGKAAPPLLWDLERYRLVGALEGHLGFVYSARFVDGGRAIITAGSDATVRLWSSESGGARMIYRGGSRFLADATLSPDGVMVVAGGSNGVVRFWDAGSGRALWTVQAHRSHVVGIHFEGEDLVTRGFGGDLSRWSFSAQREIVDGLSD